MAVRMLLEKMKESIVLFALAVGAYAMLTAGIVLADTQRTPSSQAKSGSTLQVLGAPHLLKPQQMAPSWQRSPSAIGQMPKQERAAALIRVNDGSSVRPGVPEGSKVFHRY